MKNQYFGDMKKKITAYLIWGIILFMIASLERAGIIKLLFLGDVVCYKVESVKN